MSYIKNAKPGRIDGAYTRLFGNAELGALMSEVHASTISNGAELEKTILVAHCTIFDDDHVTALFSGTLRGGNYLINKSTIKKHITPSLVLEDTIEPDFLLVIVKDKTVFVLELKDGDAFDTKKAAGEVRNLKYFREQVAHKLSMGWRCDWRVCCFNQSNKDIIYTGFKGKVPKANIMTGQEFCDLLGISYQTIIDTRKAEQNPNLKYFLERLANIDECKQILKDLIS